MTDDGGTVDDGQGTETGINPAWNGLLEVVPEDLHSQVTPHLKDWDSNFETRVQKATGEWEPYSFLKENSIPADDVRTALSIVETIRNDPQSVYRTLGETYGYDKPAESEEVKVPEGFENIPAEFYQQFMDMKTNQEKMAQLLLAKQEEEAERAADAQLEQEMKKLKEKHGDFDEDFVLSKMDRGMKPEKAIAAYQELINRVAGSTSKPAPKVLGGGGGHNPGSRKPDVTKLSDAGAKDLVVQMLADRATTD